MSARPSSTWRPAGAPRPAATRRSSWPASTSFRSPSPSCGGSTLARSRSATRCDSSPGTSASGDPPSPRTLRAAAARIRWPGCSRRRSGKATTRPVTRSCGSREAPGRRPTRSARSASTGSGSTAERARRCSSSTGSAIPSPRRSARPTGSRRACRASSAEDRAAAADAVRPPSARTRGPRSRWPSCWTACGAGELLSPAGTSLLLDHLRNGWIDSRILAGVPPGTPVWHKTGSYAEAATHDAGIVELPDGTHLIVVVLTRQLRRDTPAAESAIAAITRAAWDFWAAPPGSRLGAGPSDR